MTDAPLSARFDVEEVLDFRLARLLVILDTVEKTGIVTDTIDRIGYFDFFSANPYSIVVDDDRASADRLKLALSGFTDRQLSYRSVGERYVTRRKTLGNDLGVMLSLGLLEISTKGYILTEEGKRRSGALRSSYGDSLRVSAGIVARRIGRASRKALNDTAERALGRSWLVMDLFADIRGVTVAGKAGLGD